MTGGTIANGRFDIIRTYKNYYKEQSKTAESWELHYSCLYRIDRNNSLKKKAHSRKEHFYPFSYRDKTKHYYL